MNRTALVVLSGVFGLSVLTVIAQQPQAQPPAADAAPPIVDPPDKPTWAYAVAPGAGIAGAPRGNRGAGGTPPGSHQRQHETGRQAGCDGRQPAPTCAR